MWPWKLFNKMPTQVRYFFLRRIFTFSYELPEGMTFKIADTLTEMEQAFRIIHDGYVERNLMDENDHKLRINKYFALPTSTVIVCKHYDQVIATCSVIQDSRFGLPTDSFRDLDQFRNKNVKLVEVSGLAIAKDFRKQKGLLMIPLSKYMWEYVYHCLRADAIVISTAAWAKDFYRGLFLFEPLDNDKVISFSTVKDSKTVSQILFMKPFLARLEETYKNVPKERSLWALSKHVYPGFQYPERKFNFSSDPSLMPQDFKYFFTMKSDVLKNLSTEEKKYLAELYYFEDYKQIILDSLEDNGALSRANIRVPVSCRAVAFREQESESLAFFGEVRDVSRGGLKIVANENNLEVGQHISVEVLLAKSSKVNLKAIICWKSKGELGLHLVEKNPSWTDFINQAEDRQPMVSKQAKTAKILKIG